MNLNFTFLGHLKKLKNQILLPFYKEKLLLDLRYTVKVKVLL